MDVPTYADVVPAYAWIRPGLDTFERSRPAVDRYSAAIMENAKHGDAATGASGSGDQSATG
jgi:hypothetical protein